MISRSESLPITIETRGLLIRSPRLLFLHKSAGGYVFAVMRAVKLNLVNCRVRAGDCRLQRLRARSHSEHSACGGVVIAIARTGSGMEYLHPLQLVRFRNSSDLFSNLDGAGISTRSHDYTNRSIAGPAEITIAHPPFD